MDNQSRLRLRDYLENKSLYAHPDRVFQDVDATLSVFKSLMLKVDKFTYDDGKCKTLICLYGTIQITYRATPYNIPVNFWIPTEYPKASPLAFVAPTPNMIIKRSNYVDVSGRCYHPYLQNWGTQQNEESNLVTLCTILQNVFGQHSPVFTRTSSQSPTPPYSLQPPTNGGQNTLTSPVLHPRSLNPITPPPLPPPPPYQQNVSKKENRPRSHSGTISPIPPLNSHSNKAPSTNSTQRTSSVPISTSFESSILDAPPLPFIAPPTPLPTTQNPELVKLQSDVYEKVKQSCLEDFQRSSPEIHKIMAIGEKLNQSQENVEQERKGLLDLESKVNEKTDYIKSKITEIDKLIERAENMPEVSVDDVLCGTTIVYNQLFELVAEDYAIEDAIYYLGKALSTEMIDLNTYMKNVRTLAREQFMCRALILKIRRQTGLDRQKIP